MSMGLMGIFSPRATNPQWQNIAEMAAKPIVFSVPRYALALYMPGRKIPKPDVRSVMHRLCHLIFRTEASVHWRSAEVAKWYLDRLPRVPLSDADRRLMAPLVQRLRANLTQYESRHGEIDTSDFARIVEMAGMGEDVVLYGPPLFNWDEPSALTPIGLLSRSLTDFGWRQISS